MVAAMLYEPFFMAPSYFLASSDSSLVLDIIKNPSRQAHIIGLSGDDAQCVANYFSALLHNDGAFSSDDRKRLLSLLQRLAKSALVLPRCYQLQEIQCDFSRALEGGSFADIFRGEYRKQKVCVKAVRIFQRGDNTQMLKAFAKEIVLWAHLSHENILPFYGIYQGASKRICIISPWVDTGDLFVYLQNAPHAPRQPLVLDVTAGLRYLHQSDIVHGDLKAKNILISENGRALIADFGISRIVSSTKLTSTQFSRGTTGWMAPELFLDDGENCPVTLQSDIWSLGCVYYEIFTRKVPFYHCTNEARLSLVRLDPKAIPHRPTDGHELDNVGDDMWRLMERCWDSEPGSRPSCYDLYASVTGLPSVGERRSTHHVALWKVDRGRSKIEADCERARRILVQDDDVHHYIAPEAAIRSGIISRLANAFREMLWKPEFAQQLKLPSMPHSLVGTESAAAVAGDIDMNERDRNAPSVVMHDGTSTTSGEDAPFSGADAADASREMPWLAHEFWASLHWISPLSFIATAFLGQWSFTAPSYHDADASHVSDSQNRQPVHAPLWKFARDPKDTAMLEAGEKHTLWRDDIWDESDVFEQPQSLPQPMKQPVSIMDLPVEVRLLILEQCAPIPAKRIGADSMDTFRTLLRVSKTIQSESYKACLPRIPLSLWTKKIIRSFRNFLSKHGEMRCLVRHLWIMAGKYDEEELSWAMDVVKAAGQLRSLACGEYFLSKAAEANVLVRTCETVTLMNVDRSVVYQVKDVKRLRLCAGAYSTKEKFPNVTSLCFNARRLNGARDERVKEEYEMVDRWLESLKSFVLVERDMKRTSDKGLGARSIVRRSGKADMFSLVLPARWTEWDIWSADVVAAGIWDLCDMANASGKGRVW